MAMMWIVVAAFATYRLSRLVSMESGPGAVFSKLRIYLGCKAADCETGHGWWNLAELVHNPYACGLVFALLLFPLVAFPTFIGNAFMIILAIAGIQVVLQDIVDFWKE